MSTINLQEKLKEVTDHIRLNDGEGNGYVNMHVALTATTETGARVTTMAQFDAADSSKDQMVASWNDDVLHNIHTSLVTEFINGFNSGYQKGHADGYGHAVDQVSAIGQEIKNSFSDPETKQTMLKEAMAIAETL